MNRIAVIGLGSIGSRHLDNVLALYPQADVLGADIAVNASETRCVVTDTWDTVLRWNPTHVLVCSPAPHHYWQAAALLRNGCRVFVEKPMATSAVDGRLLCELAEEYQRTLAVGYMLRAYEPLRQLRVSTWPDHVKIWCHWQAAERYRWDIVAETSHELDLALWLYGPVDRVGQVYRPKDRPAMRCVLEHESGTCSEVDIMGDAAEYTRGICIGDEGLTYTPNKLESTYRDELRAFVEGVPLCTGRDGLAVLELMEKLK